MFSFDDVIMIWKDDMYDNGVGMVGVLNNGKWQKSLNLMALWKLHKEPMKIS